METKNIYKLKLHDCVEINSEPNSYYVIRVPGGFIYTLYRLDYNSMTSTFVPFNNEFMTELNEEDEG